MQCLPVQVAGSSRQMVPIADISAAALTGVLLADDPSRSAESLSAVLRGDPPLLLWAVCRADHVHGFQPESIDDVARWLATYVLEALSPVDNSPVDDTPAEPESGAMPTPGAMPMPGAMPTLAWACDPADDLLAEPELLVHADRVAAAVLLSEVAAGLAAAGGPHRSQHARLLGLLDQSDQWLLDNDPSAQAADSTASHSSARVLPRWLRQPSEAARAVRLAAAVLRGEAALPDDAQVDLDACRLGAAEARRRWLAPGDGRAVWLPALAARLTRLAALEQRFQRTLETEKLEAMAEFAAGAGHEINNPLTVIAGRAQLFLREEQDPERRRGLALMNAQAKRVYEMIADMMLFARPPQPELQQVDLVELIDALIEELSPDAARQEITVRRATLDRQGPSSPETGGPVLAQVDPTQLTIAIRALCQNALEAIGRDGRIEIALEPGPREVRIRVSDDGPGIPPEQRPHLFDPYYSARQAGRGLGLGLSKCWRIVTNHGGRIEVASEPGHGAIFTITLP